MSGIAIEIKASRVYLVGNTYALKDQIKAIGGHFDADERAWWVGKAKLEDAKRIAGSAVAYAPAERKPESVTSETPIRGRATYKGKAGYLVLWTGTTSRGQAAKLAFRDGSKIFWADLAEITMDKVYHDREWRGHTEPGMTFGRLQKLAKDYVAGITHHGGKHCDACGHDGDMCADMDCCCNVCGGMRR